MAAFITGCVAVSSAEGNNSVGLQFAIIWTLIWTFFVAFQGTVVIVRHVIYTPLAIGMTFGKLIVLSSQYLMLTAIFGGESVVVDDEGAKSDNEAFTVFCSFMFLILAIDVTITFCLKDHLVKDEASNRANDINTTASSARVVRQEPSVRV